MFAYLCAPTDEPFDTNSAQTCGHAFDLLVVLLANMVLLVNNSVVITTIFNSLL